MFQNILHNLREFSLSGETTRTSLYLGSQTPTHELPFLPVNSLPPWNLREMANTARRRALSAVAQRVCRLAPGLCWGPFGVRLSESPKRLRVWLTAGLRYTRSSA